MSRAVSHAFTSYPSFSADEEYRKQKCGGFTSQASCVTCQERKVRCSFEEEARDPRYNPYLRIQSNPPVHTASRPASPPDPVHLPGVVMDGNHQEHTQPDRTPKRVPNLRALDDVQAQ